MANGRAAVSVSQRMSQGCVAALLAQSLARWVESLVNTNNNGAYQHRGWV